MKQDHRRSTPSESAAQATVDEKNCTRCERLHCCMASRPVAFHVERFVVERRPQWMMRGLPKDVTRPLIADVSRETSGDLRARRLYFVRSRQAGGSVRPSDGGSSLSPTWQESAPWTRPNSLCQRRVGFVALDADDAIVLFELLHAWEDAESSCDSFQESRPPPNGRCERRSSASPWSHSIRATRRSCSRHVSDCSPCGRLSSVCATSRPGDDRVQESTNGDQPRAYERLAVSGVG